MSAQPNCTVFILTDTPNAYGDGLSHPDVQLIFIKDIESLFSRLKNISIAGLVLEIPKVMKASRQDRDRLFNYAGCFPILRTKPNPKHGFIAYLDSKESFFNNLDAAVGKRSRNHERIPVKLDCLVSRENDPSLAQPVEASVLDISPGGCFIKSRTSFEGEYFVHIRIAGLSNPRPIYSSVRWTKTDENEGRHPGMGVMFIDLTDDQMEEIPALQLTAQTR